jgi:hypothetical protein
VTSATVGIQNASLDDGLTVSFNSPYLHDGLAIAFQDRPYWVAVEPDSLTVSGGQCLDAALTLDAAATPAGDYQVTMVLETNDPLSTRMEIPILLHVLPGAAVPVGVPGAVGPEIPAVFALQGSVPNPFRASTEIRFDLPRPSALSLRVYDVGGRLVRKLVDGSMPAGRHRVGWDGRDDSGSRVSTGIYFCRLRADGFEASRRMLRLE